MVNFNGYMKTAREMFLPLKTFTIQLPSIKEDCTCVVAHSLSLMNSPVEYCSDCENKGYVETPVLFDITGTLVDFASDGNAYTNALFISEGGDFDYQRYVIHANLEDCAVYDYDNQNCFDIAKFVTIETVNYKIQTIDKSTLLGQIRVTVSKTNS